MKSKLDAIKAASPLLEIQFNLRDISRINPDVPKVFPTGRYDAVTQEAVRFFQKKNNIAETGKINFETWNIIMNEYKKCMHCINMPQSVYCYPKSIYEYKRDDEGNLIYILQVMKKHKFYIIMQNN